MSNIHPPPDCTYNLPKVGEIRCYWTLLNSELQVVYTDPVLTNHLAEQAPLIIGRSILDYVHPEEKDSARDDIRRGQMDKGTASWGSVTRVRFCRLSKVRRMLGHTGPPTYWPDAHKIAYDENYMAVDIVLNWAAQGLILCFIHASINLQPADNDQRYRTPWTNWCGTPVMDAKHIQQLYHQLYTWNPPSQYQQITGSHQARRVFQILANRPGRHILLQWPPEDVYPINLAGALENAHIDEETQGSPSNGSQSGTSSHAKTTCTHRFSSSLRMSFGNGGEQGVTESIFIPHGTIIFACHEVIPQPMPNHSTSPRSNTISSSSPTMQLGYSGAAPLPPPAPRNNGYPPTSSGYYNQYQAQTTHRYPPINYGSYHASYPPPPPPGSWNNEHNASSSSYHGSQQWSSPGHSASPLPAPAVSNLRSGPDSYATSEHNTSNGTSGPSTPWPPSQPPHPTSYMESAFSHPGARAASPGRYTAANSTGPTGVTGGYASASPLPSLQSLPPPSGELVGLGGSSAPTADVVPPSRRRVSPNSAKSDHGHSPYPSPSSLVSTGIPETGRASGSGRYAKAQGAMKCSSCKATSSPEWRKGPSGKKELCNACGLRYARSRAKKEGQPPVQRRRKEKAMGIKRDEDSATPPSAIIGGSISPHNGSSYLRGSYGDYRDAPTYRDSALPPPTSSPNTELYGHTSQSLDHVLGEDTKVAPSPPPSAVGSYLHSKGYTNVPSPLSSIPPISSSAVDQQQGPGPGAPSPAPLQLQHSHSSTNGLGQTTLPPLSYVDRMHPGALASPIAHSPLSTGVHTPASFERDSSSRELPLPAGPRRSLLTGQ